MVKNLLIQEITEEASRQYINARASLVAHQTARKDAAQNRGSMMWRVINGNEYLIRKTGAGQKSLGPRSVETEKIERDFRERKEIAELALQQAREEMKKVVRLNRALRVGIAPISLVRVLNVLEEHGVAEHFTVIGTHALYAYAAAAGVHITDEGSLATKDVDLLFDTRKRVSFLTRMDIQQSTLLGLLQKVDRTFSLREDQRYTAINSTGFEVDLLRRPHMEDDPHPLRITDSDDDLFVVEARRADIFLNSPPLHTVIVATNGEMARMKTIQPRIFTEFKQWMATQPDREPIKARRDLRQAELVSLLMEQYLPPDQG